MDYMSNCIFIDESEFIINMNRSITWTKKGERAIVTVPKTKASNITISGTVAVYGVLNISVRRPKTAEPSKKRKVGGSTTPVVNKRKGEVLSLVITSILWLQPWIYLIVTNNLKGTILLWIMH